jgi:hypothetical protein
MPWHIPLIVAIVELGWFAAMLLAARMALSRGALIGEDEPERRIPSWFRAFEIAYFAFHLPIVILCHYIKNDDSVNVWPVVVTSIAVYSVLALSVWYVLAAIA